MSKYAKIENGFVTNIIVCADSQISTLDGHYVKETDLTNNAQIGYEFISDKNKFKKPQPYPSWTLDEETCLWNPPTALPEGAEFTSFGTVIGYVWDEENLAWKSIS